MKAFLEEYGLIIVAVIIVAALIALAVYFKTTATTNSTTQFTNLMNKAETEANDSLNTGITAPAN